ncbi:hypothetical protein HK100_010297, partial [Physocladia obscura]
MEFIRGIPSCDLADALQRLALKSTFVSGAHFVSPQPFSLRYQSAYLIGRAHTAQYALASDATPSSQPPPPNPVDTLEKGQILVVSGASTAPNAYFGGLLCARAVALKAAGALIDGRVRDRRELWDYQDAFPIVSTRADDASVLGAAGFAKCVAVGST